MLTTQLDIRGLHYHIQEWGDPSKPRLLLLHGWMDCGASFKFMAEHLQDDYHLIAPDWRGFGETDHAQGYWFPDYFADLECLLDHYFADGRTADIVGHSMGGNIALMYAGIRPARVGRVLSLEALGMPPTQSKDAPQKYREWLGQILSGEPSKVYPNEASLRASIRKGNPSLSESMVAELVPLWGKPYGDDGEMCLKHDHAHRYTNPVRYNFDDTLVLWAAVTARVGLVMAADSPYYQRFEEFGRIAQAQKILGITEQDYTLIEQCAHMLHLEQPEQTATAINAFFASA